MPDAGEKLAKTAGRSLLRNLILGPLTGGPVSIYLLAADTADAMDVLDVNDAIGWMIQVGR